VKGFHKIHSDPSGATSNLNPPRKIKKYDPVDLLKQADLDGRIFYAVRYGQLRTFRCGGVWWHDCNEIWQRMRSQSLPKFLRQRGLNQEAASILALYIIQDNEFEITRDMEAILRSGKPVPNDRRVLAEIIKHGRGYLDGK